jgi:hypothetical protein
MKCSITFAFKILLVCHWKRAQISNLPRYLDLSRKQEISSSTPACIYHNSWTVDRMRVYLYFFERYQNFLPIFIVLFSWFYAKFSQQCFARSSSVQIRSCIHGSSTCALCSNDYNFSPFIRFERMSYDWKVEKVKYEFGIGSFLILYLD